VEDAEDADGVGVAKVEESSPPQAIANDFPGLSWSHAARLDGLEAAVDFFQVLRGNSHGLRVIPGTLPQLLRQEDTLGSRKLGDVNFRLHGSSVARLRPGVKSDHRLRAEAGWVTVFGMEHQHRDMVGPPPPSGREHITVRQGYCGGKPHIAGHRVKVQHIAVWHERLGQTPAEIAAAHPGLTLADVYAALAYYYDHRDRIDADIEADERLVAEQKAKAGPSYLQQKLAAAHGQDDSLPPG
jgi:uncharacterized protein (DUF433 family)